MLELLGLHSRGDQGCREGLCWGLGFPIRLASYFRFLSKKAEDVCSVGQMNLGSQNRSVKFRVVAVAVAAP